MTISDKMEVVKQFSSSVTSTLNSINQELNDHFDCSCTVEFILGDGWCYCYTGKDLEEAVTPTSFVSLQEYLETEPSKISSLLFGSAI